MMAVGEDELICDLAETYGVFDMRSLPLTTLAVLACGLKQDSRIKSKIAGREAADFSTLLLAKAVDNLSLLVWMKTKDGLKGINVPQSIVETLLNKDKPKEQLKEYRSFRTPEDFHEAWIRGGGA